MTISPQTSETSVELRDPNLVMRLDRLGSFFPSRLSFTQQLLRRITKENWQFTRTRFDINERGEGVAMYQVDTPKRTYTLIVFSHDLAPEKRTDRVIAEAWDATFTLFDGVPTEQDVIRLSQNIPSQEAGRCQASELSLSRANKSVRLFASVSQTLAEGKQPDEETLSAVGYLMRTTAVYGSGKFGCADRSKIADREEFRVAFQVEMLTVFLFRWFSIDLLNHHARVLGGEKAVTLADSLACSLGIGNSTGLGMSPFLVKHHHLINNWVLARETALMRVRNCHSCADPEKFSEIFAHALCHLKSWDVVDETQSARIAELLQNLEDCQKLLPKILHSHRPWDALYRHAEEHYGLEAQEFLVSAMLEPNGDLIDDLCDSMQNQHTTLIDPRQTVQDLQAQIKTHYNWCLTLDFHDPMQQHHFWYYSEEKLEPRFGSRYTEDGAEKEMPLTIARDVQDFMQILKGFSGDTLVGEVLLGYPDQRDIVRRIQAISAYPYGEIRDNLLAKGARPLDILRLKLSFFGANKFDPKSDLWLRVNIYQGAPMPKDLEKICPQCLSWMYPVKLQTPNACSLQHCSSSEG